MKPSTHRHLASDPVGEQAARPLAQRLAAHPRLCQRFEQILDIVERDSQSGCTAHQAERRVRDQTRALAQEVLHHWADDAATAAIARAQQQHPLAGAHAKKVHWHSTFGRIVVRFGSAAGRAADRPLQPVVRPPFTDERIASAWRQGY